MVVHATCSEPGIAGLVHLVILWQCGNVVLEGVGHPAITDPDVAYSLQGVPHFITLAQGCVDEVVKVLVVTEDNVAAHVKKEALGRDIRTRQAACLISLQPKEGL